MSNPTPVFRFTDFWFQKIYEAGIEDSARANIDHAMPLAKSHAREGETSKRLDHERVFWWCRLVPVQKRDSGIFPDEESKSLRLFARETNRSAEYSAIVDVARGPNGNRLTACKFFYPGDPIVFFTETEEKTGIFFLGGNCAKRSKIPKQCNAYLTRGRMLRCTRVIEPGEEIVRWISGGVFMEFFERIDRVVVSRDADKIGRITSDGPGSKVKDSLVVKFGDGEMMTADKNSGLNFVYREYY